MTNGLSSSGTGCMNGWMEWYSEIIATLYFIYMLYYAEIKEANHVVLNSKCRQRDIGFAIHRLSPHSIHEVWQEVASSSLA